MRRVLLVVGPPGAGKSTFAASSGLRHLEREQFRTDRAFESAAADACGPDDAQVAVVRCCPSLSEQQEWVAMLDTTEVVVLDPGQKECARRLHARGHRNWRGEVAAAARWHQRRLEVPVVAAPAAWSRSW